METARKLANNWYELNNVKSKRDAVKISRLKPRHILAILSVAVLFIATPVVGLMTQSWWIASGVIALSVMLASFAAILVPSEVHNLEYDERPK